MSTMDMVLFGYSVPRFVLEASVIVSQKSVRSRQTNKLQCGKENSYPAL